MSETAPEGYVFVLARPVTVGGRRIYQTMPQFGWFERRADADTASRRRSAAYGITPILIPLPTVEIDPE